MRNEISPRKHKGSIATHPLQVPFSTVHLSKRRNACQRTTHTQQGQPTTVRSAVSDSTLLRRHVSPASPFNIYRITNVHQRECGHADWLTQTLTLSQILLPGILIKTTEVSPPSLTRPLGPFSTGQKKKNWRCNTELDGYAGREKQLADARLGCQHWEGLEEGCRGGERGGGGGGGGGGRCGFVKAQLDEARVWRKTKTRSFRTMRQE